MLIESKKKLRKMAIKKIEQFQLGEFQDDYRLRAILAMIPKTRGIILDIGSGNGEIADFLSTKAKYVYVTENSEVLLKNLKKKIKFNKQLRLKKLDAENFYLKKKNFDLITACDVMEHLRDDDNFLRCCHLHLKKKGRLFICVPAIKALYSYRDTKYGHIRRYGKDEIISKIKNSGLTILKCQYWNSIGLLPYFLFGKIFNKEISGPVRASPNNFFSIILNKALYYWLIFESKISFLPLGLSLILVAQKDENDGDSFDK